MKLCILSACTGKKAVTSQDALTCHDFQQGEQAVTRKEQTLAHQMLPAGDLYTGDQHRRLMDGLRQLRASGSVGGVPVSADLWILSAGYGVVSEQRLLAPYECSFSGMTGAAIRPWASRLRIPVDVRRVLTGPYDLGLILLGNTYLEACAFDASVRPGGPTLVFCSEQAARRLALPHPYRKVVVTSKETTRFSCGQVGLKGELARRTLTMLWTQPDALNHLLDERRDVLDLLSIVAPTGLSEC